MTTPHRGQKQDDMPIYEYACQDCGQRFETLVRSDTVPACPQCQSTSLEKQLSVFAAGKAAPEAAPAAPSPCAGCGRAGGPGSCAFG
ncbi:FmdB family zinc ribbon protein [Rubrivivax gelatinosus]